MILDVYMVENGLCDWCFNYQEGMDFSVTTSSKQWNDCVEAEGSLYIYSKERKWQESITRIFNTLSDAKIS